MGRQVWSIVGQAVRAGLRSAARSSTATQTRRRTQRRGAGTAASSEGARGGYRGDFRGTATVEYRPDPDGNADPGEIVWTWVPYEEDHGQGKDRPVLIVAREGRDALLGLMLTSKDHDRDAADEARYGRVWMDLGRGPWDRQGRPSEVRLDRVIRVDGREVRREGAVLDRDRFGQVAAELRRLHGWG